MAKPKAELNIAHAFEADKHAELTRAVEQLTPEQAELFLHKLEIAIRKRKIQIIGYLVALLSWIAGMLFALVWYGTHDGFVGWAFVLPFGIAGVIMYAFGKWSERGSSPPPK